MSEDYELRLKRLVGSLLPMADAPRDGRLVVVGSEKLGLLAMRWDATNPHPATGVVGTWVSVDGAYVWSEAEGGPAGWRPMLVH